MKKPSTKLKPQSADQPATPQAEIDTLRHGIDDLDAQIVALINARAAAAQKIGALKAKDGVRPYSSAREQQVYKKVAAQNKGPLKDDAIKAIYREIMSASIALERPTRVAFFGQAGTFTHLAARTKFGSSVEYIPTKDIREVFSCVQRGEADYGLVPIENSTEGGVNQSIDMFADTKLKIASEIYLPIHHHLLCKCKIEEIRLIYSHPQPFAQCRNWLQGHLANVEKREVGSTAEAAERASKEEHVAAVAGSLAAELYGVPIIHEHIEDSPYNITRFFVIAERMAERTGKDKTSLVISIKDEPGGLRRLLKAFDDNKINLTRIESRPSKRRAWEYNFYLDIEGHVADEAVQKTLREIEPTVRHLEVLGSYPMSERLPTASTLNKAVHIS
ncbi:MAG TPA: prephenate dehydratase [Planctomycetota bacterium]|nr:prephenate dehydratase [Planctomycetota bacterium]